MPIEVPRLGGFVFTPQLIGVENEDLVLSMVASLPSSEFSDRLLIAPELNRAVARFPHEQEELSGDFGSSRISDRQKVDRQEER